MGKAVGILWMGKHKCEFEEKYLTFSFVNKREKKYFCQGKKYRFSKTYFHYFPYVILLIWDTIRDAGLHFWVPRAGIFLRGITQFVSSGKTYQ